MPFHRCNINKPDGTAVTIHGSNLPMAMLGVLLLWFGWIGFNGGSTLALDDRVPLVLVNTLLAGCAGMVTGLLWDWFKNKYPSPLSVQAHPAFVCTTVFDDMPGMPLLW